jgi:molybdopterin-guanine dinucleotide biosynthesis protein
MAERTPGQVVEDMQRSAAEKVLAGVPLDATGQPTYGNTPVAAPTEDYTPPLVTEPPPDGSELPLEPIPAPRDTAAAVPTAPTSPGVNIPGTGRMRRELNTARQQADAAAAAGGEQVSAMEDAAQYERQAADAQGAILEEYQEDVRNLQMERRTELEAAQNKLNEFSARYTAAAAQGAKAAPSLVEARTDAGIQAAIVSGLGALAMIVTRGNTNPLASVAADIVRRAERAIERDIQAKLHRMDSLKTATGMADRQLQNLRQSFDDDKAFIDYVKNVHMSRAVDPLLAQAKASGSLANKAAAEALIATRRSDAARAAAAGEGQLLSQAHKNAQLRLAAQKMEMTESQAPFVLSEGFSKEEAGKVAAEWTKTKRFAVVAREMVQLRRELGPLARAGKLTATATGKLDKFNRYKSLVREIFTLDNDLGAALTATEIAFGEDKIGDPLAWLTGPAELDAVLRSRSLAKARNLNEMVSARGRLTPRGRQELAGMLSSSAGPQNGRGAFAPRSKRDQ